MAFEIRKAAVIGSGVMGSGIAAQFANAGIPAVLLDIVPEGAEDRSALARGAVERMQHAEPAPFMDPRNARLVIPGNIEDDLGMLADVDWIVEAVIENVAAKRGLYKRIDPFRKRGSVVSSNTSTIRLAALMDGMPADLAADFLITHFFNPPRYMRLLEIVAGPTTRPEAIAAVRDFADRRMGKSVVDCRDTPGFIANRIGTMWIQSAINGAFDLGLTVEEADAIAGRPMGVPKTGIFGLLDLVGIDLIPHVSQSLFDAVPADDPFRRLYREPGRIRAMIETGYTGRKGKGGFYRVRRENGRREKEVIDLATGDYRPVQRPALDSLEVTKDGGLRALAEHPDKGGCYAWQILADTLSYAALLADDIADDIHAIDEAMRLGYAWREGPFEMLDRLGPAWLRARLAAEGRPVPPLLVAVGDATFYRVDEGRLHQLGTDGDYRAVVRPAGVLLLADVKRASRPMLQNESASLWNLGDGVACLEFHTKMNSIDAGTLAIIEETIKIVRESHRALVIYNEGVAFSVGANISHVLEASKAGEWDRIEALVRRGQTAFGALRQAPFPVVGAPAGMTVGGGCEVVLHCDAVEAHAETYMGLVEVGVGVIPGWGGSTMLLARWWQDKDRPGGPMPPIQKVFETVSLARVSRSAADARELRFLRPTDGIVMNRDRLLAAAKARALEMMENYVPPGPGQLNLPGPTAKAALDMAVNEYRIRGKATDHDTVVAGHLATVLSGGAADITEPVDETALADLEREAFMALVRTPATLARIEHMLETGRPLRN